MGSLGDAWSGTAPNLSGQDVLNIKEWKEDYGLLRENEP